MLLLKKILWTVLFCASGVRGLLPASPVARTRPCTLTRAAPPKKTVTERDPRRAPGISERTGTCRAPFSA